MRMDIPSTRTVVFIVGVYRRGKSKSFEGLAFTASKFFELQQQLQPGGKVSLRALAAAAQCSTKIAKKVIDQIEEGHLIDPELKNLLVHAVLAQ